MGFRRDGGLESQLDSPKAVSTTQTEEGFAIVGEFRGNPISTYIRTKRRAISKDARYRVGESLV